MKKKRYILIGILVCCISLLCLLCKLAYSSEKTMSLSEAVTIAHAQTKYLTDVGGFAGFAISPTPFLVFSTVLIEGGTTNMYAEFLQSTNPVTQAMGLACLSRTDKDALVKASKALPNPDQEIEVWTGCCLPSRMTLAELAHALIWKIDFLGHDDDYWDFQELRQEIKNGKIPLELITRYCQQGCSTAPETVIRTAPVR